MAQGTKSDDLEMLQDFVRPPLARARVSLQCHVNSMHHVEREPYTVLLKPPINHLVVNRHILDLTIRHSSLCVGIYNVSAD
jgi:hypothetical protein